jgi:arginyl-tRNA synthetase
VQKLLSSFVIELILSQNNHGNHKKRPISCYRCLLVFREPFPFLGFSAILYAMATSPRKLIQDAVQKTLLKLAGTEGVSLKEGDIKFTVERPEFSDHGDFATNAALVATKVFKKNPMEIADELVIELKKEKSVLEIVNKIEAVKPGFVNFFLSKDFLRKSVGEILKEKSKYGSSAKKSEKVNIEFISANPTGPMTLPNGRGGFFGDVLGNVMAFAGYGVDKEYYVNDAGNQIKTLGESVLAAAGLLPPAEEHYQGSYVADFAKEHYAEALETYVADPEALGRQVAERILDREVKPPVKRAGIKFDIWTSEAKAIRSKGLVEKTLLDLKQRGYTYEQDGATWLKTSEFGDDKDRVLVRSEEKGGGATYIAVDLSYHLEKWKRGYARLINIWGADHHGDVPRLQAGMKMLGKPAVEVILMQLVSLMEDGKEVRMSKRTGNFITLMELFDEVGVDVARFFFLMYQPDTHMDFDLTLAKEQSQKNPVFYVQYAHARISGIIRNVAERGNIKGDLEKLTVPEEMALIRELIKFPELVGDIAANYEVHRLPKYAMDLATAFHKFYDTTRVIVQDKKLSASRCMLVDATRIVLQNALKLMGINAPEKM